MTKEEQKRKLRREVALSIIPAVIEKYDISSSKRSIAIEALEMAEVLISTNETRVLK